MYTFESRVRFSEADHTELLTLPGLLIIFRTVVLFSLRISDMAWNH